MDQCAHGTYREAGCPQADDESPRGRGQMAEGDESPARQRAAQLRHASTGVGHRARLRVPIADELIEMPVLPRPGPGEPLGLDKVPRMETVRLLLVFLHFLGLASLLGGYLTQLASPKKRVVPAMVHGALTQLVTGVALVGVRQALHSDDAAEWPIDNAKWGIKLAVLVVVLSLVWVNRRKPQLPLGTFHGIGVLTSANVAVAVFWR